MNLLPAGLDQGPSYWLDARSASMARFYDAMLSGKDNFAPDRELAAKVTALVPAMPRLFRHNREFAARAVRHMAEQGIGQFLDLGCGLPTAENTHQVARRHDPRAQVVYVDHDPVVVSHGNALLVDGDRTAVVSADIRDPYAVFDADLLDPGRPAGVLLTSVLHHVPGTDDPHGLVRSYLDRFPAGSMLAISHFRAAEPGHPVERLLLDDLGSGWFRTRTAIEAFFDGLRLEEPGLCPPAHWRSDRRIWTRGRSGSALMLCGVARKPR